MLDEIAAPHQTETSCRICGSGNHLSDGHTYAPTGSDQKQMPRWDFEEGLFFKDNKLSPSVIPMVAQANLCADYHAAVEKVLAAWDTPPGKTYATRATRQHGIQTALLELSAVHEKAKGLL